MVTGKTKKGGRERGDKRVIAVRVGEFVRRGYCVKSLC